MALVTPERNDVTSHGARNVTSRPLSNAERQRLYRERRKAQSQQSTSASTPELTTYSEQPKRIGKDGKPKRPVAPTPRIYPPERTHENPARYGDEAIDEILRLISHGATLRQACSSNPEFPSPPAFLDWVHENRAGLAERYARARDRQLEAWADEIVAAVGVKKVFAEQVSSVAEREMLAQALDFIREGDVLVVTKLDRLARSMRDLMEIVDRIKAKGASLRILNMGMDTTTPTGELILNVLGSVAQFERAIMLERQREGIAKAKSEGKYKGRKPTAKEKAAEVLALHKQGVGASDIARQLKIGRSSVYRAIEASASA
jgi:DNA invertase Pin-like site-specific DNA recombinase